jgi:hypothetical protein
VRAQNLSTFVTLMHVRSTWEALVQSICHFENFHMGSSKNVCCTGKKTWIYEYAVLFTFVVTRT